jgi:hypothetical protein
MSNSDYDKEFRHKCVHSDLLISIMMDMNMTHTRYDYDHILQFEVCNECGEILVENDVVLEYL